VGPGDAARTYSIRLRPALPAVSGITLCSCVSGDGMGEAALPADRHPGRRSCSRASDCY
jgi:hypothetical protein